MTRTQTNTLTIAVGGILILWGGVSTYRWVTSHNKPPQVVAAPAKPQPRRGPVFNKPVPPTLPTKEGSRIAAAPTATADFDLPPKLKNGVRMYANIHWLNDTKLQLQFLGPHLGVVPGKGYCKLMPLVVPDKARPFVNTEGQWISTDPPVYELWHRVAGAKLPEDFRAVYIRNGVWYFVDFERAYAESDQIVVNRPGEVGRPYIRAKADLPPKPKK